MPLSPLLCGFIFLIIGTGRAKSLADTTDSKLVLLTENRKLKIENHI
jgi:hypothetical protein